jgi:hypothetical protein
MKKDLCEIVIILDENNYKPSNTTALLDAVGKTINSIGRRLADTPESGRSEKIIFAIITDGYENASHDFSRKQIFDMVTHQREKYCWEFIFLGAYIDAWGDEIGITLNVNIQKDDLQRSFKGLSHNVLSCRMEKLFNPSDIFNLPEGEIDKRLNEFDKDRKLK